MHNTKIKVRIFNPNMEVEIEVPQFDSVDEAIKTCGSKYCLQVINDSAITGARIHWRNSITKELFNKRRTG